MANSSPLETIVLRDRAIVLGGLVLVALFSWLYILAGAGMNMDMAMGPVAWTPGYALLVLAMWWVMMVAMMLPSAAPMILLFAAINRKQREKGQPYTETSVFAAGYLLAWGGFSVAAVTLQWGLSMVGLLSPAMATTGTVLGGILLLAAGMWQLTPLKHACLRHCRSPMHFMLQRWHQGRLGAVAMGLEHGGFCLGCCWVLMVLLFYGGVMNLAWIAGLALYVLAEKLLPAGPRFGILAGAGLIVWGGIVLWMAIAG
jgi:predicted metal-binding membrane protein